MKNGKKEKTIKVEKKNKKEKHESWIRGVFNELKKVTWPNRKNMLKYSIATIIFIIFFALFFYLIELLMAFLKSLV